eukprot:m.283791 g.283791  ORF g.283791 m.283791 type:complete len:580 (+) comp11120_c0_seq5:71-1810(+)
MAAAAPKLGTPTADFSLSKCAALLRQKDAEGNSVGHQRAKDYLCSYAARTLNPPGVFLWTPSACTWEHFTMADFKTNVLPKEAVTHSVRTVGENGEERVHSFVLTSWFIAHSGDHVAPVMDPARPRVFADKVRGRCINLFPGYMHGEAMQQPYSAASAKARAAVDVVLRHVLEVLCSGSQPLYEYWLSWMGGMVQGIRQETALYFKSGMGAGKSIVNTWIQTSVLGEQLAHVTDDAELITGKFNMRLKGKLLCVLEEPDTQEAWSRKALEKALRQKITGATIDLADKRIRAITVKNTISYIINTNEEAVALRNDDRRFVCFDVSDHRRGDTAYFTRLAAAMAVKGAGPAFAAYVREFKASAGLNMRAIPESSTRQEIIVQSLGDTHQFLKEEFIARGSGIEMLFAKFFDRLTEWRRNKGRKNAYSRIRVSKDLKAIGIESQTKKVPGSRVNACTLDVTPEYLLETFRARGWMTELDDYVEPEFAFELPPPPPPSDDDEFALDDLPPPPPDFVDSEIDYSDLPPPPADLIPASAPAASTPIGAAAATSASTTGSATASCTSQVSTAALAMFDEVLSDLGL